MNSSRTWENRVALAVALAGFLALVRPCAAVAQDLELPDVQAPCEGASALVTLEVEGAAGFWIPSDATRCMLGRLQVLPEVVIYARALEARQALATGREDLLRRRADLAVEEAETATGALDEAVRRAREAEESRDAWYRAPALWAVIGGAVVVALEIVAIVIFKQVSP